MKIVKVNPVPSFCSNGPKVVEGLNVQSVADNLESHVIFKYTLFDINGNKASLTDYMATSLSTSVVYKLTDSDQLAVGITKYRNRTQYLLANFTQPLDVPLYSLGYRHDFNDNLFIKAQIMQSSSVYHQINKPETKANGVAAGVGIGVTF